VTRCWTEPRRCRTGGRATASELRQLVPRLAAENPTWGIDGSTGNSPGLATGLRPAPCDRS
jgi:hypothetical protein